MATFKLNAEVRTKDEVAKKIIQDKGLVGIVYGKTQEPISLKMAYSDFLRTYRKAGESQIIVLSVGKKDIEVVVHATQKEPVSGDFRHVDFYALTQGEKLTTKVHIEFVGESQGVKDGGLLQETTKEIEVSCLPKDLVESFEADLSKLAKIGDTLTIADLGLDTAKYDIHANLDDAIASVSEIKAEVISDEAPESDIPSEDEEKAPEA
jgi:large subunit ribosomal protein L25